MKKRSVLPPTAFSYVSINEEQKLFRHSGLDPESRGEERDGLWHPPSGHPWIPAFAGMTKIKESTMNVDR